MMIRLLEKRNNISVEEFIEKYENGYFGGIIPKSDDTPIPWDPDIELKGDTVIITGSLVGGNPQYGTCICKVKKDKFFDLYDIM